MPKKAWVVIAVALGVIFFVTLWFVKSQTDQGAGVPIRIGAILPLTGSAALLGTEIKQGMELAIKEINSTGGIGGRRLEVIFLDSKNDAKEGVSAARKLLDLDQVPVIITAMSSVTMAIIPIIDKRKIVLFSTVTATPGLTQKSQWVFRDYYTTDTQGEAMARFLTEEAGVKAVAVLYINDDYGVTGTEVFRKIYSDRGGNILTSEAYEKASTDLRAQITKAMMHKPEAIHIIAYGQALAIAVRQIRELGYKGKILSYTGLVDQDVLKQAGSAAEGAIVVASTYDPQAPVGRVQKQFIETYREAFAKLPSHYPAFGYDATILLVEAMRGKGYLPEEIRQGLLTLGEQELVLGTVRVSENREVAFTQVIKIIRDGKPMTVVGRQASLASWPTNE